jgi:hypothetical protein
LKRSEDTSLSPDRAKGHDILGFVELGPRQQLLVSGGFNLRAHERQLPNRLAQEGGLARFDLHHRELNIRKSQLERNCRRAASRADVHEPLGCRGNVPGGHERLEQEPIDTFIHVLNRSEIDLPIPSGQQLVVRDELFGKEIGNKEVRFGGSAPEPAAEITRGHA